jgi:3-dehydro-scyllo-inosose hydrolase
MGKWEIPPKGGHLDLADGIYFQNMTMKEVEDRLKKSDLIIIPVGSTECHGLHACYGEDTFLVTRMAEAVAKKVGCTVSQPIWFGSHPYHHIGMPGTIPIDEDIFTAYISQVIAGFWNAGFRKQILLNGHGQEYVLPTAIHRFARRFQVPGIFINLNWYYAIPQFVKDKAHGGPFETPFIHADEAETSFSLALFPEMIRMEHAVDTEPHGFLPPGHIDTAANAYQRPIPWYAHAGCGTIEVVGNPEGSVGKATLANAEKAKPGLEALFDYMEKLIHDIMEKFPPGKVPPLDQTSQRFTEKELEDLLKGPLKGGKHLYTVVWPAY